MKTDLCLFCGDEADAETCDCLERRDCVKVGEPMHITCGPCKHDNTMPLFACPACYVEVLEGSIEG